MIVLAGASASGKTEVAKQLADFFNIKKVVTTTTREKRNGERDGVDYHFVDKDTFLKMLYDDKFIEYTEFNDNYYGSTKDGINLKTSVVIDPEGLKSYMALKDPSIITFYLMSTEEVRFERMMLRGDNVEDARKRIINDRTAFADEKIPDVDFRVNSQTQNVEQVTRDIYQKYIEELTKRGYTI
ncbi:MAG: guanylate kinase [Coprobacillus sp.]|nr:guanylate kinase [Coprobacillus sp.]